MFYHGAVCGGPALAAQAACGKSGHSAQAMDDDVADPSSAGEIMKRISSENKYLYQTEKAGHLMPMNEGRFDLIKQLVPWQDRMDGILS